MTLPRHHIASFFVAFVCILAMQHQALAQDLSGQANDIKAVLQRINGQDPVERVLAAQQALTSDDPQLRSFALEACLSSQDKRVRDAAFRYIVTNQKKFNVEIGVTERDLDTMDAKDKAINDSPGRSKEIFKAKTLSLKTEQYDQKTDTFAGDSNLSRFDGSIAGGSITIRFQLAFRSCVLVLKGYNNGLLTGSFTCGSYSFAAQAALP